MTLTNYWWLLIWMFTGGIFLEFFSPKRYENVLGKKEIRWSPIAAFLMGLPLIFWSGFRGRDFGDTIAYKEVFEAAPSSLAELSAYVSEATKDKGFSALIVIIKSLVGNNSVLFFLIIAAFQMICVLLVFRKYSCNFWLSMYFFIASTTYLLWMHSGIRQFIAVTMIFATTGLIAKKKYLPVILIILLASTIHMSALLMIPIVFIIQGKALNKRTILCIIAVGFALVFVDRFTEILDTLLADTQYTNVVSDWTSSADDGTNPIRALVYSVPAIMSVVGLNYIHSEDDTVINIAVNASVVSACLMWLSVATSGIFMGRLSIYTDLYPYCQVGTKKYFKTSPTLV